jgi:hypothetical protein
VAHLAIHAAVAWTLLTNANLPRITVSILKEEKMNKRIKYSVLTWVVLAAACFQFGSSSPQSANGLTLQGNTDGRDFLVWQKNLGLTPGQFARITVADLADTRSRGPITFRCMAFDQNGVLVFQTAQREMPPRGFRFVDVNFGDLGPIVGDPATDRKQVMIQVVVNGPRGSNSSDVLGSLELVNSDGTTAAHATLAQFAINGNSL